MNYLVTLNTWDYMSQNVRESFQDACSRWGISYYEITECMNYHHDVCFSKLLGIKDLINNNKNVRGILYMDSDMLIRNDTPNPFEIFNDRSRVYAVRDFDSTRWEKGSESYENVKNEVATPWVYEVHKNLRWDFPERDIINCTDWFFNAGLFLLYVPESLSEIDEFVLNTEDICRSSRYEQAMWNYILRHRKKIFYIPSKWNRINPETEDGDMKSFIYHFTGVESFIQKVKHKQKTYNWRINN